jgi:hypothetical protein
MGMNADGFSAQGDEEVLLPGERLLWSGSRARLRRSMGEYLMMFYLLVLVPIIGTGYLWQLFGQEFTGAAASPLLVVFACGWVAQWIGYAWYVVVAVPRGRRSEVYRITDLRVLVTSGVRRRSTASAWLYQIQEPVVRGTGADADLLFAPAERGSASAFASMRAMVSTARPGRGVGQLPVFHTLADADTAREVAAAARHAVFDASLEPPQALLALAELSLPAPVGVDLAEGERVLWTGSPSRSPRWFGTADVYQSVSAGFFSVFALVMGLTTLTEGAPPLFLVPILALACLGFYWALGRVLVRSRRASSCRYVLTNERLITSWRARRPVSFSAPVEAFRPPSVRAGSVLADAVVQPARKRGLITADTLWPFALGQAPALVGLDDPVQARTALAAAQLTAWHARRAAAPRPN